ncbi:hypothetical protein CTAYLR_010689 [Chrysophaeum taylorii]|uniref:UNC93-like protein MFSD11 n=1 Tax=Chrysophaeum taylorii TaxID=2483200 RepID=A0AAD7U988_9STRA|nr:hypothetical protein CTAYLR_010689 [Chrysophaeum taylorii]
MDSDDIDDDDHPWSCRVSYKNTIITMAWGFLFIFAAFNTTQTIVSTALQRFHGTVTGLTYDLGSASLMIIYVTTCPSLLLVPDLVHRYGAVWGLVVGGVTYAVYIASLAYAWEPAVAAASCAVGFGQALIWVSQGVVLTSNSDEATRGRDAGCFWGIYSCSGIVGPAVGYLIYRGTAVHGFFLFAAVCTLVGTFIFRSLLRPEYRPLLLWPGPTDENRAAVEEPLVPLSGKHHHTPRLGGEGGGAQRAAAAAATTNWTRDKTAVLLKLTPFMFFVGSSDAFVMSTFPLIFAPARDQEAAVFLVFFGWGLAETLGGLGLSRFSDTIGRRALVYLGASMYLIALALSWLLIENPGGDGNISALRSRLGPVWCHVSWLSFVAGALFGLSDALSNTQAFALIGDHFADATLSVDAYAAYQLFQAIGMAAGFALSVITATSTRQDRHLIFGAQLATIVASVAGIALL